VLLVQEEEKLVEAVVAIKYFPLLLTLIFSSVSLFGQEQKVDAKFLYNYYEQDGNNSPVTGGIGTEELSFHGPSIVVNVALDSISTFHFDGGVDVYSSASTDNIDFNVSSASAKDARTHVRIGMSHFNEKKEQTITYNGSFSIESDYTSFGLGASYAKGFYNYNTVLSIAAQVYVDDCRWGRLSAGEELRLVYPQELRGFDWEGKYLRQTYSLSVSVAQLVSKRMNISVFGNPTLQNGLLATTFHRIYFSDAADHVVERLPYNRIKLPIGLRANYFAGDKFIFRGFYRFYADNWNITAHSFELEVPYKITPFFSLYPFYRYHIQSATSYFNPYGKHLSSQDYYTSDYDLSEFTSHKYGMGVNFYPVNGIWVNKKRGGLLSMELRGGVFNRSNGLNAFYVASVFNFGSN
jgi:hypothetical protein